MNDEKRELLVYKLMMRDKLKDLVQSKLKYSFFRFQDAVAELSVEMGELKRKEDTKDLGILLENFLNAFSVMYSEFASAYYDPIGFMEEMKKLRMHPTLDVSGDAPSDPDITI